MKVYYNEIDPKAAAWLRELGKAGAINEGRVDERSIHDVTEEDIRAVDRAHFFAGIGGWDYALHLAGWPSTVPVWTGSCPCQPFSSAGRQQGERDPRHLWPEFARIIGIGKPSIVFGEQVASKAGREWLSRVRADLEGLGYAVGAADLCAAGVGAPHIRQRLYWVAHTTDADRRTRISGTQKGTGPDGIGGGRPTSCSPDGRMDDPASDGTGRPNASAAGGDRTQDGLSRSSGTPSDGRLGQPVGPRLEGFAGDVGNRDQPGRDRPGSERPATPAGGADDRLEHAAGDGRGERRPEPGRRGAVSGCSEGFWDAFDIVPCRDGKARRIEPGTFPLADGVSGRVGLLRGYGNAIVPEVAATFIVAVREVLGV